MSTTPAPSNDISLDRAHFIGIGGAGMSGLANILLSRGATVSGSDAKDSAVVEQLRTHGAHVAIGHDADNLSMSGQLPTVVITSFAAIPKDNPELLAAAENNIPVIRRSDLLALLMSDSRQVLLAGTHGKTSTTSMTVVAMQAAGLDPSFAIGGQLTATGAGAHHGSSDIFIAEADESDASLLSYQPTVAVVTNIEPDHLDFFNTPEAYFAVFDEFSTRLAPGGTLVVCLDDEHAAALGERATARGITVAGYGTADAAAAHPTIDAQATITASRVSAEGTTFTVAIDGRNVEVTMQVPGRHMMLNATAALLAGHLVGGDIDGLTAGLSTFGGVRRRFELRGRVETGPARGAVVYDDYAHHPTEVAAVLRAAADTIAHTGQGRVLVVFQPHMYSRTIEFAEEFGHALSLADEAIVLDVYGAREQPVDGVDGNTIARHVTTPVTYEPDFEAVPARVKAAAQPGDLIITMGAGTVTALAQPILDALRGES